MTSKNIADYFQPSFYRFSEDSIYLSNFVTRFLCDSEHFKDSETRLRALDLCAGCGVVGIEVLKSCADQIDHMDFVEIQSEFASYFSKNVEQFLSHEVKRKVSFINKKILDMLDEVHFDKYHLIFSNPPYFEPSSGRHAQDERRGRCRFFMEDSLEDFLKLINKGLLPNGKAFFLMLDNVRNWEILKANVLQSSIDVREKRRLGKKDSLLLIEFTLNI